MTKNHENLFNELVELCKKLREKEGCLWDREQTHESLIPFLKEESEEVIHAIKAGNTKNLQEELGDLLYQVIFHSQIASENNEFSIENVLQTLIEKLIRRHPHVFGDIEVSSVEEIIKNWEKIKSKEKK